MGGVVGKGVDMTPGATRQFDSCNRCKDAICDGGGGTFALK